MRVIDRLKIQSVIDKITTLMDNCTWIEDPENSNYIWHKILYWIANDNYKKGVYVFDISHDGYDKLSVEKWFYENRPSFEDENVGIVYTFTLNGAHTTAARMIILIEDLIKRKNITVSQATFTKIYKLKLPEWDKLKPILVDSMKKV